MTKRIRYLSGLLLIAALIFRICNPAESDKSSSPSASDSATDDTNIATTPLPPGGCYAYTSSKDTATIKLDISGPAVSGQLVYKLSEKDRNIGTIKGEIKDSLIIADYTFESEGMISVREVVFKIKEERLLEGYGDVDVTGDTVRFKDLGKLQFLDDRAFRRVECDE